jgi:hypothetical protein
VVVSDCGRLVTLSSCQRKVRQSAPPCTAGGRCRPQTPRMETERAVPFLGVQKAVLLFRLPQQLRCPLSSCTLQRGATARMAQRCDRTLRTVRAPSLRPCRDSQSAGSQPAPSLWSHLCQLGRHSNMPFIAVSEWREVYECAGVARCVEREAALCDRVQFDAQEVRLEILVAHHQLAKAHTVCCGQVHLGRHASTQSLSSLEWCKPTLFRSIGRHCNQWRSQQVGMGAIDRKSLSTQSWDRRPLSACKFSAALVATRRRDTPHQFSCQLAGSCESFSREIFTLRWRASHVGGGDIYEAPSTDGSQSRVDVGPRDGQEV